MFHLLPDRRSDFGHSERLMQRRNAGSSQVVVSVGGEDDKVCGIFINLNDVT